LEDLAAQIGKDVVRARALLEERTG
jgi:hypothetical protein